MSRDLPTFETYRARIERTIRMCERTEVETGQPMGVMRLRNLLSLASRVRLMGRAMELRERLRAMGYDGSGRPLSPRNEAKS